MTFDEFLEKKGMTPENTPNDEHGLAQEAYKAGYEEGRKSAVVWHKIDPDSAIEPPLEDDKRYLVLFKDGDICSATFWRGSSGYFFEAFDINEIEAWAEMPEARL